MYEIYKIIVKIIKINPFPTPKAGHELQGIEINEKCIFAIQFGLSRGFCLFCSGGCNGFDRF